MVTGALVNVLPSVQAVTLMHRLLSQMLWNELC
ncbi:hypothetical protein SAMN05216315_10374 [Nitrosospira sp. Nsp18]|nr:hypothetical protein SAMN05216315_10374 [Nitrosospira sp. Nsp18]